MLFVFNVLGLQAEPVHRQLGLKHCESLMWSVLLGAGSSLSFNAPQTFQTYLGLQAEPVHWQLGSKHCKSLACSLFVGSWVVLEVGRLKPFPIFIIYFSGQPANLMKSRSPCSVNNEGNEEIANLMNWVGRQESHNNKNLIITEPFSVVCGGVGRMKDSISTFVEFTSEP